MRLILDEVADSIRDHLEWQYSVDGMVLPVVMSLKDAKRALRRAADAVLAAYCLDCEIDTIDAGEYYMVVDEIWVEHVPEVDGMLCVGCLEKRMGRRLAPGDFTDAPVNRSVGHDRSVRLQSRLNTAA